jgi:threonyl-tRNA synthetase
MDQQKLAILRHSTAHLLAHAVKELYPDTMLTIGPPTEMGFFYDLLPKKNFKEEDLLTIENKMREISARNLPLEHNQISKAQAREIFKDNPFKLELIDGLEGDTVGLAKQGDFLDLCRGGHVASTGDIKHFKLTGISGAYWRANRDGQALQRISGVSFFTKEDLENYLKQQEDLVKYDHRRLGKQLDLFSFHEEGPGFPFFHPRGKLIFNKLVSYVRNLLDKAGYQEISTPIVLSDELWQRSGHYAHYKENMYFTNIDERSFAIKPMNCPGAIMLYNERPRSYRELPLRLSEFGLVHRHELSGVLNGLLRVRAFTQDDAHIFCMPSQIESEIKNLIDLVIHVLRKFGFNDIQIALSTRPAKAMGVVSLWDTAENALQKALDSSNVEYELNAGDGAFYGPKIDFRVKDSMGRLWQLSTIQLDFFQPENFDLSFINNDGKKERPVIIHRALYGSIERFMAILLEHHKGNLPFFVAPEQVRVIAISDEQLDYAKNLNNLLIEAGIRSRVDEHADTLSGKIKVAQLAKIPWMAVLGKKEVADNLVTLRYLDGKQESMSVVDFVKKAQAQNC